jgi:hypothetical protein
VVVNFDPGTGPDKLGTYLVRNHDGSIHRVVEP